MAQATGNQALRRRVDLWGVVALGLGTAMGVSIFSALGAAAKMAGPGLLLAVLIAAIPMGFIAVAYAFMGSVLPTSGASYEWPRRFLHPAVGFGVSWLRIAGNAGALVILALVLTRYLSMLIPVPVKPTMFAAFLLLLIANLIGVGVAANVQKLMMAGLLVLFAVFCACGAASGQWQSAHLEPLLPHGWAGVVAAVPLLINLFYGIESATELGDEIADSRKTVGTGILLSIGTAVLVYLAVAGTSLGLVGATVLGESPAPIVDAAKLAMGPYGTPLVVFAAVLAIAKSMNAIFMVFSRSLFAMGRSGALPPAFAKVHPRWNSPHVACIAVFALAVGGLLLPTELTFLFLAINVPILIKYFCICLSARVVLKTQPQLCDGFSLSRNTVLTSAVIGAVMTVLILIIGFDSDWRPYALLAGWSVLGAIVYLARRRHEAS
ncbi:amino acid permease [Duganella sp. FT80W]|uniref:Amino acid permease n=1 Tax=Duganella guangzhouensis TaxID=2666084 RepID=A0A6I2L9J4_9BURK|nr:amino acid permease [Duganella guangzhouensis]MRW93847.1 amino acid permease [Duganella guangzhouensis]